MKILSNRVYKQLVKSDEQLHTLQIEYVNLEAKHTKLQKRSTDDAVTIVALTIVVIVTMGMLIHYKREAKFLKQIVR